MEGVTGSIPLPPTIFSGTFFTAATGGPRLSDSPADHAIKHVGRDAATRWRETPDVAPGEAFARRQAINL